MQSLDVLRGVAVLMVLATHAFGARLGWTGHLARLGSYGVDLFFVLSGFLISGLLFAELDAIGILKIGRFWLRRGLKIWPSYYAAYGTMLALGCARSLVHHNRPELIAQLRGAVPNLFFVQNYVHYDARWLASWSLAVEEHFYLGLPIALTGLFVLARRPRWTPWLCGAVIAACPLLRIIEQKTAAPSVAATVLAIQTHYRIDALCWGVLIGYANAYRRSVLTRWPVLTLGIAPASLFLAWLFPWGSGVTETIGLSAMAAGFAAVVALAINNPRLGERGALRLLARAGVYSYTIYLAQAIAWSTPASSGFALVAVSIVVGVGLSHAVERPMLRLRSRLVPSLDHDVILSSFASAARANASSSSGVATDDGIEASRAS